VVDQAALAAQDPTGRLYNNDLRPAAPEEHHWSMFNFSDFARFSPSRADVVRGNAWGLPFNWTAFALTSVIVSAASVKVYGQAVLDPAKLLEEVDNEFIVLAGSVVFVVATIGVNIVANFVSAAFDLSNLNPQRISFKTGGIIASVAALLSTPWNLYNSPQVIAYFLGGLGALLGPFFGIMAVDYFVHRRARSASRISTNHRRGRSTTTATASTRSRSRRSCRRSPESRPLAGSSVRHSERSCTTSSPRGS
jgi:NCS1 nucleoside transporter family